MTASLETTPASEIADAWREAKARVVALARERRDDLGIRVPATPDWSAKDLIGHMVAVGVETVDGTAEEGHPPEWTAQTVEKRRDRSLSDVLAEWDDGEERIVELITSGAQPGIIVDLATHEQDLRGALDAPGARVGLAAELCTEFYVGRVGEQAESMPALLITTGVASYALGKSNTASYSLGNGEPAGSLAIDGFELWRAVSGRRSRAQVAAYAWPTPGGEPWIDVFSAYGAFHDVDIYE